MKPDGNSIELQSTTFPLFEGGFVRFVIEGTFMDIKKAQWFKAEHIAGIEMINEG